MLGRTGGWRAWTAPLAAALVAVAAAGATPARADEPTLTAVSCAAFKAELDKLRGKPALIDYWATWCVPCREKFPKFVALAAKHHGRAAFVSGAVDDEDAHDAALKFLKDKQATGIAHYRFTDDAETVGKELGAVNVPRYVVRDAAGAEAYAGDDFAKAEAKLAALLAAAP